MANDKGIRAVSLLQASESGVVEKPDLIAVEEPLEIRIASGSEEERKLQSLVITMRTPGNDFELVMGFLLAEGIITSASDVLSIRYCSGGAGSDTSERLEELSANTVRVELDPDIAVDFRKTEHHSYISSSCGVCGKLSIEALKSRLKPISQDGPEVSSEVISSLPDTLRKAQRIFSRTGGVHATGIFTLDGELLLAREDVGRHNAMDKVFGAALHAGWLPLNKHIVCVSGRVSFEIVQKALAAGATVVAAVGAPSSLAVDLAEESGLYLFGFVNQQGFNLYTGRQRLSQN